MRYPSAPQIASLSRVTMAVHQAHEIYVVILEPKPVPAPRYDLEKIAMQQTIRDQQREIEALKTEVQKLDGRLFIRRAAANKTSIGMDLVFPTK